MISRLPSLAAPVVASALILAACRESPTTPAGSDPAVSVAPAGQLAFSAGACPRAGGDAGSVRTTPGGVTHARDATQEFDIVTNVTQLAGVLRSTRAINAIGDDIAQERAVMVLSPSAFPGSTWEIVTVFRTLPYTGGLFGRGTGRGTGELRGLTLSWQWEEGGGIPEECSVAFVITGTVRTAPVQ